MKGLSLGRGVNLGVVVNDVVIVFVHYVTIPCDDAFPDQWTTS